MNDNDIPDGAIDAAVQLAESFEGFSAEPYRDTLAKPPVWTIGFGSTRVGGWGDPVNADTPAVTRDEAQTWMARELQVALGVLAQTTSVPLTYQEAGAILDFIYNLGVGAFESSTLLRKVNAGDFEGAAQEFDRWDHAGGVVCAGLLRRRQAETDLFNAGANTA